MSTIPSEYPLKREPLSPTSPTAEKRLKRSASEVEAARIILNTSHSVKNESRVYSDEIPPLEDEWGRRIGGIARFILPSASSSSSSAMKPATKEEQSAHPAPSSSFSSSSAAIAPSHQKVEQAQFAGGVSDLGLAVDIFLSHAPQMVNPFELKYLLNLGLQSIAQLDRREAFRHLLLQALSNYRFERGNFDEAIKVEKGDMVLAFFYQLIGFRLGNHSNTLIDSLPDSVDKRIFIAMISYMQSRCLQQRNFYASPVASLTSDGSVTNTFSDRDRAYLYLEWGGINDPDIQLEMTEPLLAAFILQDMARLRLENKVVVQDDINTAIQYLERAVQISPSYPGLQARLRDSLALTEIRAELL